MPIQQFTDVLQHVSFQSYAFEVLQEGGHFFLRGVFPAACNKTGATEVQRTRKWRLSVHMTKSEIVQTAFKCVLTSVEHETREQFTYRNAAIFGPHFDVDVLARMVHEGWGEDARHNPFPAASAIAHG